MDVRFHKVMALLSVAGVLAACGDDGPDEPFAAEAVEVRVLAGGDASHGAHDDVMADGAHDEAMADGAAGSEDSPGIVVEVEMVEFGFVTAQTELPVGQPVTFRFSNTGVVPHEAMFGTLHQQGEFAESGSHGDGHGEGGHHGDVAAITLDAGEVGEIVLEFGSPGEIWIGCHLPGHYEAGMKSTLWVA